MQSSGLGMDSDNDIYTGHCSSSNLVIRRRFLLKRDYSYIVGGGSEKWKKIRQLEFDGGEQNRTMLEFLSLFSGQSGEKRTYF